MNNRRDTYCYLLGRAGSRCLLGQGGLVKLVFKKRNLRGKENEKIAAVHSSAAARLASLCCA